MIKLKGYRTYISIVCVALVGLVAPEAGLEIDESIAKPLQALLLACAAYFRAKA